MAESRKPVISVHDLAKNYGELKVLRKIDMDIYKGEVVSVIGPSGSGKSTFLRCLNYLEELTSGEIDIGGVSLKGIDEDKHNKKLNEKAAKVIRKNVGMVFQQFNLWPHKTVLENVMECPVQVKKANKEDLERWTRLYYVGAQAFESGIMQGELAAEAFLTDQSLDKNGDGIFQYVVLEGEAGHQDAIVRTEYSVSTMIDSGVEVEKLGYAIANWNRAQAQTKMAQLMSQFGDSIELVIANNDDMALGAIDALKASDLTKDEWPAVIGIDGTDVGLEAVKNKEMIGTVYNDKEGQADAMLNLAYELSTGGDLSDLNLIDGKYIRLPYARVTCDDVDSYMEGDTE